MRVKRSTSLFLIVQLLLIVSQGSVATYLQCGGIFSNSVIAIFFLILTVKIVKIG